MFIKEPNTALFVAQTGVVKTHFAFNFLEKEYITYFKYIIIICPTLKHNETYRSRNWFWIDPKVILVEPDNLLYDWIEKMGKWFAGC